MTRYEWNISFAAAVAAPAAVDVVIAAFGGGSGWLLSVEVTRSGVFVFGGKGSTCWSSCLSDRCNWIIAATLSSNWGSCFGDYRYKRIGSTVANTGLSLSFTIGQSVSSKWHGGELHPDCNARRPLLSQLNLPCKRGHRAPVIKSIAALQLS